MTRSVNEYVPGVVATPTSPALAVVGKYNGLSVRSAIPGGSEPSTTDHAYGPLPPVATSGVSTSPMLDVPKSGPDTSDRPAVIPVPVTGANAFEAFEVMLTVPLAGPPPAGRNRTTSDWLVSEPRLNVPPETMLNGAAAVAVPVSTPPPRF